MLTYILWNKRCGQEAKNHILHIGKNRERALAQADDQEVLSDDDGLICEFSSIGCDDYAYCTQIDLSDDTKELYFLKINESGGGGSYHSQIWLYVTETQEEIIDIAEAYFDNEHNRDSECDECKNDSCRQNWIQELKETGITAIECTTYEGASFEMWRMKIGE